MPNHVENDLYIYGEPEELARFLNGLKRDKNGSFSILDSYFPMPEKMAGKCKPVKVFDTQAEIDEYMNELPENVRDLAGRPFLREDYAELMREYGVASWYDWALAYWGTKWGDYDDELRWDDSCSIFITFNSAWSPPEKGMERVASLFPELRFSMYSYEAGCGYQWGHEYSDGKLTDGWTHDYHGCRGG